MDKRLTYRYFDDVTPEIKTLLRSVNCLVRSGYVLYKYTFNREVERPAILFSTDITPYVVGTSEDTIKLIAFQDLTLNAALFETTVYTGSWDAEIQRLERLLDEGEIVFLEAEIFKLPFHVEYRGEAFFSHHRFPIVGHDEENFYYVEPPWELNGNFVPLGTNNTIGVFKKNEMRKIIDDTLYFILPKIMNNGRYDEKRWFRNMLQRSVDTYSYTFTDVNLLGHNPFSKAWIQDFHRNKVLPDGNEWAYFFGKDGIARVAELLCEKEIPLNKLFRPSPRENLLFWYTLVVGRVLGKRFILSQAMKEYSQLTGERFEETFIHALNESIKTWEISISIMIKKIMTQEYAIDAMLKKRLLTLQEVEENLINEMSNYLATSQ